MVERKVSKMDMSTVSTKERMMDKPMVDLMETMTVELKE